MDEAIVRQIAREEVASLCGLVLRRLEDVAYLEHRSAGLSTGLKEIFGEALRDFSQTPSEPGPIVE